MRFSYNNKNKKKKFLEREIKDITFKDMVIVGIAQGFTILPGISRSGMTVAALLFRNFNTEVALKLSFLMSIPAIIGGVTLEVVTGDLGNSSLPIISSVYLIFKFLINF